MAESQYISRDWWGSRKAFERLVQNALLTPGYKYYVGNTDRDERGLVSSENGVIYVAKSPSQYVQFSCLPDDPLPTAGGAPIFNTYDDCLTDVGVSEEKNTLTVFRKDGTRKEIALPRFPECVDGGEY